MRRGLSGPSSLAASSAQETGCAAGKSRRTASTAASIDCIAAIRRYPLCPRASRTKAATKSPATMTSPRWLMRRQADQTVAFSFRADAGWRNAERMSSPAATQMQESATLKEGK